MTGYRSVSIHNCNTDLRSIYVWVFDHAEASTGWQELGSLAPQFDEKASCPAENSTPLTVLLDDGHLYDIVCVDTGLNECPGDYNPPNAHCIRLTRRQIVGKEDGATLPIVVTIAENQ